MRRPCEWFVVYSFNTNNISMLDSGWLQGDCSPVNCFSGVQGAKQYAKRQAGVTTSMKNAREREEEKGR